MYTACKHNHVIIQTIALVLIELFLAETCVAAPGGAVLRYEEARRYRMLKVQFPLVARYSSLGRLQGENSRVDDVKLRCKSDCFKDTGQTGPSAYDSLAIYSNLCKVTPRLKEGTNYDLWNGAVNLARELFSRFEDIEPENITIVNFRASTHPHDRWKILVSNLHEKNRAVRYDIELGDDGWLIALTTHKDRLEYLYLSIETSASKKELSSIMEDAVPFRLETVVVKAGRDRRLPEAEKKAAQKEPPVILEGILFAAILLSYPVGLVLGAYLGWKSFSFDSVLRVIVGGIAGAVISPIITVIGAGVFYVIYAGIKEIRNKGIPAVWDGITTWYRERWATQELQPGEYPQELEQTLLECL